MELGSSPQEMSPVGTDLVNVSCLPWCLKEGRAARQTAQVKCQSMFLKVANLFGEWTSSNAGVCFSESRRAQGSGEGA